MCAYGSSSANSGGSSVVMPDTSEGSAGRDPVRNGLVEVAHQDFLVAERELGDARAA